VMLGRLRLTVDEAIQSYKKMWTGLARQSISHVRLPRGKGKASNIKSLEEALSEVLKPVTGSPDSNSIKLGCDERRCRT
jgi:hypothetical protein